MYVNVGGVTVIESAANPIKELLFAVPESPPNDTCPLLAEPLTALNKFPNDKFVLGIFYILYQL
jgi:hypothetical protein